MTIDPSNLGSIDPQSVEGLFLVALGKQGAERAEFLNTRCTTERRQRVEAMLAAYEQAGGFLEQPAHVPKPTPMTEYFSPSSQPGVLGKLGPYEILAELGRGGMGVVFKARDPQLQRIVAVKTLSPELARLPSARQRFLREARAAAAISHPHVVTIFAVYGTEEASLGTERATLPFLVMECIIGQTLQDKIQRAGMLKTEEIVRISRQMAEGLSAAHQRGLIHRDIKPANILLENGVERVKITDFGLARTTSDGGITHTGEILGTPQCMSPEQARGELMDQRSDLFSLGCVIYTMCTGVSPFRADNMLAVMKKVCESEPHPVAQLNPNVPEWLCALVHQLLQKEPERRIQTAGEVVEMLEARVTPKASPVPSPIGPSFTEVIRAGWKSWIPDVIVSSAACGMVAAAVPNNLGILPTIVFFVVAWLILLFAKMQGRGNWPWVTWPLGVASLVSLSLGIMLTAWVRMGTHSRSGMFVFGLALGIFWLLTRWFPGLFIQNARPVSMAWESASTAPFSLHQPGAHWSNALLTVTVLLAGGVALLWTFLSSFGMPGTVRDIAILVLAATASLWIFVRLRAQGVSLGHPLAATDPATLPLSGTQPPPNAQGRALTLWAVVWRSLVILIAVSFLGAVLFSVKSGIDFAIALKNDRAFFVIRTPRHEKVKYVTIDGVQAILQPGGPGEWRLETTSGRHEIDVSFANIPPLNQERYFKTVESVDRAKTKVITAEPGRVRAVKQTPAVAAPSPLPADRPAEPVIRPSN